MLCGTPNETAQQALALTQDLHSDNILWVCETPVQTEQPHTLPHHVKRSLGRSFDAVVISLHQHLSANLIGQCQGFVWGGGALILRCQTNMAEPTQLRQSLTIWPDAPHDVGTRFWTHMLEQLRAFNYLPAPDGANPKLRISQPERTVTGTSDQDRVVDQLSQILTNRSVEYGVVLAARGRGKSAALGRAIAAVKSQRNVGVTAGHGSAVTEVLRFANCQAPSRRLSSAPSTTYSSPLNTLTHLSSMKPHNSLSRPCRRLSNGMIAFPSLFLPQMLDTKARVEGSFFAF